MRQSSRLIINTATVYIRMSLGLLIGLLLTRQLLDNLGEIDFGLFLSVGAAWAFLNIFLGSLQGSGQRYLAYDLGTDDFQAARKTFGCLCAANGILALVVLLTGWLASDWILENLEIPASRQEAAAWIYYAGFLSLALVVALSPYSAALLADQRFPAAATIDLGERIITLMAAYSMSKYDGDPLIYWAVVFSTIQAFQGLVRMAYATNVLPWARIRVRDVGLVKSRQVLSFASWMLLGSAIMRMRLQGTLLIFNVYFGNAVASAQGIAMQLALYQNQMTAAITQTVRPMLTGQFAREDHEASARLTLVYSKVTSLAAAVIGILVVAETETLLELWLTRVPPYAVEITQWTMLLFLFNRLSIGYMVAMQAKGNLAGVTLMVQLPEILFLLPVIGYVHYYAAEPWYVPAAFCAVNAFLTLIILPFYAAKHTSLSMSRWFREVAFPAITVMAVSYGLVSSLAWLPISNIARLALAVVVNTAMLSLGGWFFLLDQRERCILWSVIKAGLRKLSLKQSNET